MRVQIVYSFRFLLSGFRRIFQLNHEGGCIDPGSNFIFYFYFYLVVGSRSFPSKSNFTLSQSESGGRFMIQVVKPTERG